MKRIALGMAVVIAIATAICWQSTGTFENHSVFGNLHKGAGNLQSRNVSYANPASGTLRSGKSPSDALHSSDPAITEAHKAVARSYGRLPLTFEPNGGQTAGDVRFLTHGPGFNLFLTGDEAVLALRKPGKTAPAPKAESKAARLARLHKHEAPKLAEESIVRMSLLGSNPNVRVGGLNELPTKANYFIGNNPAKWRTNIPTYAKVKYTNVYPGVDMVYYGTQGGQLEYDFVVAPGADASAIGFNIQGYGKSPLKLAADGDLVIHLDGGDLRMHKPVVYQPNAASKISTPVEGSYRLDAQNRVHFALGAYDHAKPLYIDPVLVYATYLGGTVFDAITGVATLGAGGSAYVTGWTASPASYTGVTDRAYMGATGSGTIPNPAYNAFIAELNPTGTGLVYYTYFGGTSSNDQSRAIAVDSNGYAYVAGTTENPDFPDTTPLQGTASSPNPYAYQNYGTGFVAKFDGSGALLNSSFLGGIDTAGGGDSALAIALGTTTTSGITTTNGNVYVTGQTGSHDFPTTGNAYMQASVIDPTQYEFAAFVTEFNWANCTTTTCPLTYSTIIGPAAGFSYGDTDQSNAIALDVNNVVYLAGSTYSVDFVQMNPLPACSGSSVNAGCLVGTSSNPGNPLALQVATYGLSIFGVPSFPTGFALALNTTKTTTGLIYSTFLGGSYDDSALGIAIGYTGNTPSGSPLAYVTGSTSSVDFSTYNALYPYCKGPSGVAGESAGNSGSCPGNAFVSVLGFSGGTLSLNYSTYLGGSANSSAQGIAVDPATGFAYVVGQTGGTPYDFPIYPASTALGNIQPTFGVNGNGSSNAFMAELNPNALATCTTTGSGSNVITICPQLLFSTYMGGDGSPGDQGNAIALGAYGEIFLAGLAGVDFPTYPATTICVTDPTTLVTNCNTPNPAAPLQSTLTNTSNGETNSGFVALIQSVPYAVLGPPSVPGAPITCAPLTGPGPSTIPCPNIGLPYDIGSTTNGMTVPSGAYKYLTVTNTGNADLYFLPQPGSSGNIFFSIIGGPNPGDFSIDATQLDGNLGDGATHPCSYYLGSGSVPVPGSNPALYGYGPLPVNTTCSVGVQFTPEGAAGDEYATACVNDNALNGLTNGNLVGPQQCVYLHGTASGGPPLTITASSASIAVGAYMPQSGNTYGTVMPIDSPASPTLTKQPICFAVDNSNNLVTSLSPAGTYITECSGAVGDYTITYATGTLIIGNSYPLTITADNASKTYGQVASFGNTAFTAVGLQGSDSITSVTETSTDGAPASAPVSSYNIVPSGAVISGTHSYNITYNNGTLTVGQAPLSIAASSGSFTYGGTPPTITPAYSGFVNGESSSNLTTLPTCSTTATSTSHRSGNPYPSSCSGAADPNYSISYVGGSVTINQAPLVITASNGSMTYGGTVPTITATYANFVNGDTASTLGAGFSCSTTATSSSHVSGTYTSSCSGAVDSDYSISYVNGSVTISPAPLVITASNGSMTYGGTVPTITAAYASFVNGDMASALGAGFACSTTATSSSHVSGTYTSSCSGAVDSDYTISYVKGSVTINPAPLVITASNGSMTYGGTVPTITAAYASFVNGDMASALGAGFACSTTATSSSHVSGTYTSSCSGAVDSDYTISYVKGSVTINPAPLVITASSGSMTYGGTPPTITATYASFVNGDTSASLTTQPTCSTTATSASHVSGNPYSSSCTGAADSDYTITTANGTVTVSPALLTITAGSGTMTYGGTVPTLTPTFSGLVAGNTAATMTADGLTCSTTVTAASHVAGSPYPSTCSGVSDTDYSISYVAGTVTVSPAALTITAGSGSMTYGGTVPTLTPTFSGLVAGNTAATMTADGLTCSTTVTPASHVAGSPYPSTCSGVTDSDYSISYVAGTVTVSPAALTITAGSGSMTYGGTVPTLTPTFSGLVAGNTAATMTADGLTCSTTVTPASHVAGSPYPSTCSGVTDSDYSISYVAGTVTVSPAALTITAGSGSMTYGGTVPTLTPTFSGLVAGNTAATMTADGLTCSTTVTPASHVAGSPYPSTCSGVTDSDYSISYVAGTVTVSPAALTITAGSGSMTYGGTVPTLTPTFSGLVAGNTAATMTADGLTCSTTATAASPVAGSPYPSTCSGVTDSDYSISYVAGTVTVTPAALQITASSGTMTYGGTVPSISPSYSGFVNGQGASVVTGLSCSTTATSASTVAGSPYASTCSGATAANYAISYVAGSVSVTAASLQITAGSGTMTYGGSLPTLTPAYNGFVNGQGPSVVSGLTCSTTATSSSTVAGSPYASTCSGATAANYTISYVAGSVSVTAASLQITAGSGTMTYGGSLPTLTPAYNGFVNGQGPSVVSGLSCSTTATSASSVGSYPSTCSGATAANYTISYIAGSVSVGQATLTITASSSTELFGVAIPAVTPSYSGFVNGNSATDLTMQPVCTTSAILGSLVGSYTTSCSGAVDPNYTISYVNGTAKITAAALKITANNASIIYGAGLPTFTVTYTGSVDGIPPASLTTPPNCTTTATSSSPVATYPITCSGAVDPNYTITYSPGTLTINPAALVVTAGSTSMVYGTAPSAVAPTYSGFVSGQSSSNLSTQASCSTTATASSPVASYPTSCSGAADANYTITYVNGTDKVTPASLTITASSTTMTAGSTPPAITASYSGFVNGDTYSSLTTQPTCSTTVTSGSPTGTYAGADTCSGAVDANYTISYVAGSMTVNASTSTGTPIASLSTGCITFAGTQVSTNCSTNQVETLTNIGNAPLTITSIADSGPNANDFNEATTCPLSPSTLAPGASCTITVSFSPTTVGQETAVLTITDNSNNVAGTTQTVGLAGPGLHQIQCNFNGTSISGGNWIWFNSVFTPKNIPSSGAVTYSVSNASVSFTANGNNYTVPLPNSLITLSSSVTVATTTFDSANNRWITLAPLTGLAGNIFLNAGAYQVPSGGLPGGIQNVNWHCSFNTDTQGAGIQWQWAAATYNNLCNNYNQLCVKPCDDTTHSLYQCSDHAGTCEGNNSSNHCWKTCVVGGCTGGGGSNCTGSYSGTGSCNPPVCALATVVNCTTYQTQALNTVSTPQAITIVNNSSKAITGFNFSVTGEFAISSNTCGTSLAAGATCIVYVTFDPTLPGTQTGTLTITDSACNSPQSVNLAGNLTTSTATTPGPIANLTPTCMNFTGLIQSDCQSYNQQPGAPQVATLTNIGTGTMGITSVALTGPQAADFSVSNNCGTTLAAGASCTISITFNPQTVGPSSASLVVTDNSNDITGSTQSVSLNGAGQTQLQSNFNESNIGSGHYLWFSASLAPQNINNSQTTNFYSTNGVVTFTQNNQNYAVAVPDCQVTFSPSVSTATTSWDSVNNRWVTVAPTSGYNGNTFLSAVAYQIPNGLPGNVSNVAWTAAFSTDTPGASLTWQWAAAPYTQLPTITDANNNTWCDYSSCNSKPVDGNQCNQWNDSENAGTPEGCQSYCYRGATCDGVSNHTGNYCQPGGPTCKTGPVCLPTCTYVATTPCNNTCPVVPITYCNKNSVPICITKVQCTGDFQNTNNVCNVTLQPGQSCTIDVTFCPSQKGTRCGNLNVTDNTGTHTVCLTGDGY